MRPESEMIRALLLLVVLLAQPGANALGLPGEDDLWIAAPPRQPAVDLYFFWSSRCPHCLEARPFIESLARDFSWIRLHSLEIYEHPENRLRFREMARLIGTTPQSVPTFMWCGKHAVGYGDRETSGRQLREGLAACYHDAYGAWPPGTEPVAPSVSATGVDTPWLGRIDAADYSLPVLAVLLGAVDAFNPCAFFILLFLLSLLVNTQSRRRMLLVGGVFVAVSGLVYFAFMAAWLNLFQVLGSIRAITAAAGVVALAIAALNVKDYFRPRAGPSVSITEGHRAVLFSRMRGLLATERLPTLLAATLALAVAANLYELLCTLGLPMVFTRVLTLEQLPTAHYYGYLALYNLVYVTPLAVIVVLFAATMGRRKLRESEGRFLKLLSGSMMAGLGLVLLIAPDWLSGTGTALGLVGLAAAAALALHAVARRSTA
jgi:hypothetical protein